MIIVFNFNVYSVDIKMFYKIIKIYGQKGVDYYVVKNSNQIKFAKGTE